MSNSASNDWSEVALGEHAYVKARIGWRGLSSNEYTESGAYLIAGTHIKGARIEWEKCDHINEFRYEESPEIQLKEHDVVISKDGTIGRLGYVENMPGPATINGTMMLIRPESTFYPKFVYFYLQGDKFQKIIKEKTSGSSVPHIFQRDMVTLLVPRPPLREQQKISSILSSVDDVIEKTRTQIGKLKDLKTGMMQELLSKGIGHTEFKDSRVGRIPTRWNVLLLDEVASRGSGHTPSKSKPEYWNGGVDWVSLSDTNKLDQLYITTTAKQISDLGLQNSSAVIHPPGTVVLSRDAGIGKSGIITKEMAVSQHFMAWRCSDRLDNHFLYYILQFWKPKFENIAMGSTIKTIGLPFFKKLHVPVPPASEQKAIAGTLKSIDLRIFSIERKLSAAMALKKALMQDLLTGKVRVKVDQKESAVA